MATATWTGGAHDGNAATAGNWSGGSGAGSIPGAGDDILIAAGGENISSGLSLGVSIVNITVTSGFTYSIVDNTGTGLTTTAVTGTLRYGGAGPMGVFGCSGTIANVKGEHTGGIFNIQSGTLGTGADANGNPKHTNSVGEMRIGSAVVMTSAQVENLGILSVAGASNAGGTIITSGGSTKIADRTGLTITAKAGLTQTTGASAITGGSVENGATLIDNSSGQSGASGTPVVVQPLGVYLLGGIPYSTKTVFVSPRGLANPKVAGIAGCTVTATVYQVGVGIGISR